MKKIITTKDAPAPIGPYSQAVEANGFLFVSGQIGLDPASGNMDQKSIEEETKQVLENIRAILTAAGLDFTDVVKSTIYLTDLNNFSEVNKVYGSYFESKYPARETVQVDRLPKDARVEISVIAKLR
ncbi:MAG: RidA family protein [Bacteroidetes bacterium]|nr:RidA family protein [Bacteroidota bacterium]